jgi:hypothetical protein
MEDGPCVDDSPIRNDGFPDLCWTRGWEAGGRADMTPHISTSTFASDPDFNLQAQRSQENVPSGNLHSYWKGPFIVDLHSYKMVMFISYVSLPEGNGQWRQLWVIVFLVKE